MTSDSPHISVLLSEVIAAFSPVALSIVVDGTIGAGGHAESILSAHPEIDLYLGIDQDPAALQLAEKRLKPWGSKVVLKFGNFADFVPLLKEVSSSAPCAILADIGVSSMQLDQPDRGFSFMSDGPLDMRMNPHASLTAAQIVNEWSEKNIGALLRDYGEERQWRKAARAIVEARQKRLFSTTQELKNVLLPLLASHAKKNLHPLTLVFQALRICVNRELEVLEAFLPKAIEALAFGGRLAVISFHSLEDRIVKNALRFAASDKWETSGIGGLFLDKEPVMRLITKKPIEAGEEEVKLNPRSRSAKLRIAEKISP